MAQAMLDRAFLCQLCDQYFKTQKQLDRHKHRFHPPPALHVNGTIKLVIHMCFHCASQLEKAICVNPDGSSELAVKLCAQCTQRNVVNKTQL